MNTGHGILLVSVVLIAIGLNGCGGSKYIVKGLTLPAGAAVKESHETDNASELHMFSNTELGKVRKAVVVSFDSTLEWPEVCNHINGCLEPSGFSDSLTELDGLSGIEARIAQQLAASVRVWTSPDGEYIVELVNYAGLRSLGGGMIPPSLGDADYMMAAIHCEPGSAAGGGSGKLTGGMGAGS